MLFERASEVAGFDRYVLARVANKTDQRSMLFSYPQQRVAGAVGQQSPFVNGNNGVLKLCAFLRSEQKRFDCLHLYLWDLAAQSFYRFRCRCQEDVILAGSNHSSVKLFQGSGLSGAGEVTCLDP